MYGNWGGNGRNNTGTQAWLYMSVFEPPLQICLASIPSTGTNFQVANFKVAKDFENPRRCG